MTWELVVVLALITYGSRASALVFLPSLPHDVRLVIDRLPSALFAALAAYSLVVPGVGLVDTSILAATAGAIVVAPARSLPICLAAGIAAYLLWGLVSPAT
jgi:branched-subunit amino acid transport protein